jgi:riboflavin kinase/FMN adenylyltransferase
MQVIDNLSKGNFNAPSFVTVGSYDGVHIGHQYLLKQMKGAAAQAGCLAVMVTFHPRPQAVLAPDRPVTYLTMPDEKIAVLDSLGLDLTAVLRFTREMARTSAADFVAGLVRHLKMRQLWVGADFALGRNREGDIPRLRQLGQTMGFEVAVVEPFIQGGEVVSSTRIRHLLTAGEIRQATALLGRYPSLAGRVTTGARRGRRLGFPTANLSIMAERVIPADGVYAGFAWVNERRYPAVANIGVRPSFSETERIVEAHLLDFSDDLYGLDLKLEFVERLRPEKRFEALDALVTQIRADAERAALLLAQEVPTPTLPRQISGADRV